MSAAYEPGTVAVATIRGMPNVRVMRVAGELSSAEWASAVGTPHRLHEDWSVTDIHPLVVLDLPERVVPALVEYLRGVGDQKIAGDWLDLIADQIEAQTKPPKPAEPTGLGAVVEDAAGKRWTRVEPAANATSRNPWYPADCDEQPEEYANIDAVRVLSEGVPA